VTFVSVLSRLPGAETTTSRRWGSEVTIRQTFLIWAALASDVPPNLATFIAPPVLLVLPAECRR
jgi:hypothetical protein